MSEKGDDREGIETWPNWDVRKNDRDSSLMTYRKHSSYRIDFFDVRVKDNTF